VAILLRDGEGRGGEKRGGDGRGKEGRGGRGGSRHTNPHLLPAPMGVGPMDSGGQ